MGNENKDNLWFLRRDDEAVGAWIICASSGLRLKLTEVYAKYKLAQREVLRRNSREQIKLPASKVVTDFDRDENGDTVFWLGSDYEEDYQSGSEGWVLCNNVPFKARAQDFVVTENEYDELTLKPKDKLLAMKRYSYFNIDDLPDNLTISDCVCSESAEPGYSDEYSGELLSKSNTSYTHNASYEPLLSILGPDLYEKHPCRVLRLPINASMKEISKRSKKLDFEIDSGIMSESDSGGILPLPLTDKDMVNAAVEKIKDPIMWFLYGIFWFRHSQELAKMGISLTNKQELNIALKYWRKMEGLDKVGIDAKHNIAIAYHLIALAIERNILNGTVTDKQLNNRASHWKSTYNRWQDLVNSKHFEQSLMEQLKVIEDPRVMPSVVKDAIETLPRALLGINAELAINSSLNNRIEEAKYQIKVMNSSCFGKEVVRKTLNHAAKPIVESINSLCPAVANKAENNLAESNYIARDYLRELKCLLSTLDLLIPGDYVLKDRCHNEVALTLRSCVVKYGNYTRDYSECLELAHEIEKIARGTYHKNMIKKDINFLTENLPYARSPENQNKKVQNHTPHKVPKPQQKTHSDQAKVDNQRHTVEVRRRPIDDNHNQRPKSKHANPGVQQRYSRSSNKIYAVRVMGHSVSIPQMCTCCMKSVVSKQSVCHSWNESYQRRGLSFNFPICRECISHQSQLGRKRSWLVVLASAIPVVVLYLINSDTDTAVYADYLAHGLIASFIAVGVLSILVRLNELNRKHASRNQAVDINEASLFPASIMFRFSNYHYAHAFAQANNSAVIDKRQLKYTHKTSLLRGRSAFEIFIWVGVLAFLGHSIAYLIINNNAAGDRAHQETTSTQTVSPRTHPGATITLTAQINAGKQNLHRMESELEQMGSAIESLEQQINSLKSQIRRYELAVARGQYVSQSAYKLAIENHNSLVEEYNSIINEIRIKYAAYEKELKRVNGLIDRYNRR